MNSETSSALLPSGFEDLLPPHADAEYQAISLLMSSFGAFGYQRVKPPMAEFEESLLGAGPGSALSAETFRVMDPVTHRMMGLRSDITAQIARIAQSRLAEEERPLRLMYANDVIRTKASQARTHRQFTQVGCELIGRDEVEADIEICLVALKGLAAVGLKSVTLDFALPSRLQEILDLSQKDTSDIDGVRHDLAGSADKSLKALDELGLKDLDHIKAVIAGVREGIEGLEVEGVELTLDPLETQGFDYHQGLAFTLFAADTRGELGRGGRYDLGAGEDSAVGFTIYMDTLRQALPEQAESKIKVVSKDAAWSEVLDLQNQGFIVKRG